MNTDTLIKYKQILINTFISFDKFCTDNELNYYACGGTAIGTVRHDGIIPWDDDIDVYMPRADYEKLLDLKYMLSDTNYSILSLGDDSYIYPFAKYIDKTTTLVETDSFDCLIGVYIDIFPMDSVCNDIEQIETHTKKYVQLLLEFQLCYSKHFSLRGFLYQIIKKRNFKCAVKMISTPIQMLFGNHICDYRLKRFKEYESELSTITGENYYVYLNTYGVNKEVQPKQWYDGYTYHKFESYMIRLQNGYHHYLSKVFGDYMSLPPIEKRVSHHAHYYLNLKEALTIDMVKKRIKEGEHLVY